MEEIKDQIVKQNDKNFQSKLFLENQIKQVATKIQKENFTDFEDSSNLQYLFLNLLNSLEKSVDILWIFFIELENVYVNFQLKGSKDFKRFQDSGKIMELINDFKFIKGILGGFIKEKGNSTDIKDLELGNLEALEPFLAVNEVILGILPDSKLDKNVIFSKENSKYHHAFFLFAQEKELEILELKEKLKDKKEISTDCPDSENFQQVNFQLLKENLDLKKQVSNLENSMKFKDSENSKLNSKVEELEKTNNDLKLQIAELKYKSASKVDLLLDEELNSKELSRRNSDFTQAVDEMESVLTFEHSKLFQERLALSKNDREHSNTFQIPQMQFSCPNQSEENLKKMFMTLESMDSKINLLARPNDQNELSDHLVLAENCLEELKTVKETLYNTANVFLSPATATQNCLLLNTGAEVGNSMFGKTVRDLQNENERLRDALANAKEFSFSDAFKDISSVATQVELSEHKLAENDKRRLWAEMQRLCDELSAMQDTNKKLDSDKKLKEEELMSVKNQLHHLEIAYGGSQKEIMKMANEESNVMKEKAELMQSLQKATAKNLEIQSSKNLCTQENKNLVRQLRVLEAVTKSTKRENRDMYEVLLEAQAEEQDFMIVNQQLSASLESLQREFRMLDEKLCDKTEINKALSSKLEEAQKFIAALNDKCQRADHDLHQSNVRTFSLSTELDKSKEDSQTFQSKLLEIDAALHDQIAVNQMQRTSLDQAREMIQELKRHSKNLATQLHDNKEINKVLNMKQEKDQKASQEIQRSLLETTLKLKTTQQQLNSFKSTAQRLNEELTCANDLNQSLGQKLTNSKSAIRRLEEDLNASNLGIQTLNIELSNSKSSAQKLKEQLKSEEESSKELKSRLDKSIYTSEKILEELNVSKERIQALNVSKERIQALNVQQNESETIIMQLDDKLKASEELNKSLNHQIEESELTIQRIEKELQATNEYIQSINSQLIESRANSDRLQGELKANNILNQSLNIQISQSESSIKKLEEELKTVNGLCKSLDQQLAESEFTVGALDSELKSANEKIRSGNARIQSLEKNVSNMRDDYEASSKRSSILIRENNQLKEQVHETEALNTTLNMEIAVLNQKVSKLQSTFNEAKELLKIPITIQQTPQLEIQGTLPELTPPKFVIRPSEIKELEDSISELSSHQALESDKLKMLSAKLGELFTEKLSKKKKFVDNLQAIQRNMNGNAESVKDYDHRLGALNDHHRKETRELSKREASVKAEMDVRSKTLRSLKEKKKDLECKLKKLKKQEISQKKFYRNQINHFNHEYMKDLESLNTRRSELFNNLQTFEHMLESLVSSKEKLELAYKNEQEKLENNQNNSKLYHLQLNLLNFSFDTEFLILNGKEESINQSIKKLKTNINQLEEAKSNFKTSRDDAESYVRTEYKVNFEDSFNGLEDLDYVLEEPQNHSLDHYEDHAMQQLSKVVELLGSQNEENRILDEMAFINMRDGYEARIKEINHLRDETARLLNINADQERIINDSSQQLEQYKKESENFKLIMNNIMELQAKETETISLRESRKFKNRLKPILENAKELKLQKEELESKFQVFELEKIDWTKAMDQLKISNNHLSKQNELISHELQDSKIKLRMKSLDELEKLPKEKTVEEKERILGVLSSYKSIRSRIQEDLNHLKSIDTENTSKEVIYFVQIGYETFLDALQVIIQYLSADVGITKNSATEISEIQVSKIRNKILSVENIVNYASRVFGLAEESASLYQFVSQNQSFKDALKAEYDEASIKASPSIELLMDQGLTNLFSSSKTAEKDNIVIMDIISQRNHYKKAFDELTQQLASKVSESVESQTSVINLNIEDLKSTYETKINKLQNELEKVISERKFLKSSYRHSQEEQDKAFRLVESHRLEKDKIIAEKENLLRQITILESVKQFIEQSFEQSQEELGKSKSKIERLKEDFEAVSLEKSSLQSALVQNQSQIAKLNTEFEQLAGDYKSKEFEKQSLDASYSRTQIEVEQLKSKISQAEKKSKAFESEGCILQKNLNSLSLQLIDSVRDANDLRSLNQKLLSDYNTLVDKLFQQNGKVAQIVNEQNLATTLKDVNQLLDEARSNEITLSNNLKDRNATITDLSEKLRKESQEKLEIEKNYQKTINDLSLHHTHALETKDTSILVLEDVVAQNKRKQEKLENELTALELKSQEELRTAISKIERLKKHLEAVSLEKSSLQSALVQNQSQISKLNTELKQLAGDYKSKEFEKRSLDASYSQTQIEVEQLKSKISQAEKKSKALESEGCILQSNLDSLSLQLNDSVRDANDLRSLNQKLLSDYNTLVDKLFQQNGKVAQIVNEQNLATTLKDVNQLLDEARSNEIALSSKLKDRNATITDLSEKLLKGSQEKVEAEKNYQKIINDLSLQHTRVLETKDKAILVLEDVVAQNKRKQEKLENELAALELKEENLDKNFQLVKKELSDKLESNVSSGLQLQKDSEKYIQNVFLSLEESLDKSQKLSIDEFILNLIESVQIKILKPGISKKEESKAFFKQVSSVLIGLESLLSKIHASITEKKGLISKQMNQSVSIISGIINATTLLEDFAPLASAVSQHLEGFKKSLLDEGVHLWIDPKIQFQVADAIRMAIEQSKKTPTIILKSPVRKVIASKALSPETPLIKDILNSPSANAPDSDQSWLVDQDLKRVHEITKQSIMDTIGTVSNVYRKPKHVNFSSPKQLTEVVLNEETGSLDFDAELARMKSITEMNISKTLSLANSLKGTK